MKKRSLFAAVAMLIVSAIVLTSATYAWFSTAGTVTVDTVYASISASDASLQISADQSAWGDQVTLAQLAAQSGNKVDDGNGGPVALVPVSFDYVGAGFVGGSITSGTFKAAAANSAHYVHYTVYLKADAACTVTITPSLNSSSCNYIYGYVECNSTKAITCTGLATGKYFPVVAAANSECADTNDNRIVDSSSQSAYTENGQTAPGSYDAPASGFLGSLVSPVANPSVTASLTANTPTAVVVYMWAEGQNLNCKGSISSAGCDITLSIVKN